jgi:hypothetical protein
MDRAWGRVLIAIGVIVALLALAALEVVTARLPAEEFWAGRVDAPAGSAWLLP